VSQQMAVTSPPASQSRRSLAWLWILLAVGAVILVPVIACGAFGFALALGTTQQGTGSVALGPSVGLIRVEGPITSSGSSGSFGALATSDSVIDQLHQAAQDPNIMAIVLRINSPGGEVVASDEIHHAITQIEKPIVVSMGSLAASGGYYIAAPTDYIYATPNTFTGSIGVISQFITAQKLLDEIGVEVVVITAGEGKDFGSFHRDMTDEEQVYWQSMVDQTYANFVDVVAQGRGLTVDQVQQFADGRVIIGTEALELGLVDEIGYLDDAIRKAGELGGIQGEPRVHEYVHQPGLLELLYGISTRSDTYASLGRILADISGPRLEYRYIGPAY